MEIVEANPRAKISRLLCPSSLDTYPYPNEYKIQIKSYPPTLHTHFYIALYLLFILYLPAIVP